MSTARLSVIIATSPGREHYLTACLHMLKRQIYADPIELIIVDDGSAGMNPVIAPFEPYFAKIEYLWRPNDHNLSRSRNLGAAQAQGNILVFLNTDILLNPYALSAYARLLKAVPQATCWGYVGCRKRYRAPSIWLPEVEVNWLDFRFFPTAPKHLYINPELKRAPHTLASGHHFALTRESYTKIGPLNEDFTTWGEEDVEFALRGLLHHCPMLFLGDAWAEHMAHDYTEEFHHQAQKHLRTKLESIIELEQQLSVAAPQSQIVFASAQALWQQIQQHYLKFAPQALQREQNQM